MSFNKFLQISIILLFCLFIPLEVEAVVLYLEPSSGEYPPGQSFVVKIKIDTEKECINAIAASLSYDKNLVEVINFSQGESIISLWLQSPKIDEKEGKISFTGGIPGGYCGRIPGDPGEGDILGKIIFKVPGLLVKEKEENIAEVKFLEDCQVLLNDGLATEAKLTLGGAEFKILERGVTEISEWEKEISEDKISPESFEILVSKDPKIFEGKYFIIFQTLDKQTGIDYFEILEADKRGYQRGTTRKAEWKRGESPYLLEDQELKSIIKVRAVDKAGNERTAEYVPPYLPLKKPFPYWIVILSGIVIGIIWWIIRRFRNKWKHEFQ